MHVGNPGNVDIQYTVTRNRNVDQVADQLPDGTEEEQYFESDPVLHEAFPDGEFNCWGVPERAEPSFNRTDIGDLVLFIPTLNEGIRQIGVVSAKCPFRCTDASRILWPDTPHDRLFPFIFFFDTKVGHRGWYDFLDDVGYESNWDPRGWYRPVASHRFSDWGGPEGYLEFLRDECDFSPL